MYFPKSRTVILEVPKCGSRTLVFAGKKVWGENYFAGHLALKKILARIDQENRLRPINWQVDRAIRIFREPIDRFVSGLNYEAQTKNVKDDFRKHTLDYLIDRQFDGKSNTIYNPQHNWCPEKDQPVPVITFPIHRMKDALEEIGYTDTVVWENRSKQIFTRQDVENHPRYDEICKKYEHDFELWEKYK